MKGKKLWTTHSEEPCDHSGNKGSIKIRDEEVSIEPLVLFQGLVLAGTSQDDLQEICYYELCSNP